MSDDEESLSDIYPRAIPEITNISKDLIQPSVPEVSLISTNGNFFNDRPQSPPLLNQHSQPSEPKHFASYNEWKKNFYSNRQHQNQSYSSLSSHCNEPTSNNPKQGILKKSYPSSTSTIGNNTDSNRYINSEYITNQNIQSENFSSEQKIKENNPIPPHSSTPPSPYFNYPHYNPYITSLPPAHMYLDHHHPQYNPYPYPQTYPYPRPLHHNYNVRPEKFNFQQPNKIITSPTNESQTVKNSEKSIQIEDIFNLISKQNEQIENLQKQIEILMNRQSEQDEERRKERELLDKREREWREEMERRKEEEERWRRRIMDEEKLKREQYLKEQEEKSKENCKYLKNKTQLIPFDNKRRVQKPVEDPEIETIDITNTAKNGRKKMSIGVMTSFVDISDSELPKEVSLTLHGLDLANVPEPSVSPEPPVHVQLKDYPESDESDSETQTREPQIGWTFYNNVVGQVNKLLKNAPQASANSVPTTKRVTFESPSDTSLKMNALASKYLNEHQLREFAQLLADDKKASDPMDSAGVNLSQATMRYMERYDLLPHKSRKPVNKHRLLDLNILKQQPKLL